MNNLSGCRVGAMIEEIRYLIANDYIDSAVCGVDVSVGSSNDLPEDSK